MCMRYSVPFVVSLVGIKIGILIARPLKGGGLLIRGLH